MHFVLPQYLDLQPLKLLIFKPKQTQQLVFEPNLPVKTRIFLPFLSLWSFRWCFDSNAWEHNQTLFGGNTVPLGEFNGSISGLIPGEKYYFRVFAESADGTDWSSGAPEVDQDLMAYWRMDESNGTLVYDSVYPLYTAQIQGLNADKNRSVSIQGNGITLDGWSNSIDIDLTNTVT